jgi:hypothetical protein
VSVDGDMIGGVPVPLYLDMEKEKEEKKSTEKKGWSALLNVDNQGKRRKMTRTGTTDNDDDDDHVYLDRFHSQQNTRKLCSICKI